MRESFQLLANQGYLFNWTLSVLTVISSLLLSWGVYKKSRLERVHKVFILTLFGLAIAHFFRSMVWLFDQNIYYMLSYWGFLLVPLFLTLFLEEATQKPTALWFKVYILLQGSMILYGIFDTRNYDSSFWKSSFAFYHAVSFVYLGFKSLSASARAINKRESSIFKTLGICIITAFLFGAMDWASRFGLGGVKLSTIPTLMLIYFLTVIFFSQGAFQLRKHILKLSLYGIFPLSVVVVAKVFFIEIDSSRLVQVAAISYFTFVPINILSQVLGVSRDGDSCSLMQRINQLSTSSPKSFLTGIQSWDEVTKVHLVSPEFCQKFDLSEIVAAEADNNYVVSYKSLVVQLERTDLNFDLRRRLEAAEFVLRYTDCDFLCVLGGTGSILVAKFSRLMDITYYYGIMTMLANQLTQIIEKVNLSAPQNTKLTKVKVEPIESEVSL